MNLRIIFVPLAPPPHSNLRPPESYISFTARLQYTDAYFLLETSVLRVDKCVH